MDIGKAILMGKFKDTLVIMKKLKNIPEEQIRIAIAGFFTSKLSWAKTFVEADKYSAILDFMTVPLFMSGKPAYHILINNFYKSCKIMRS